MGKDIIKPPGGSMLRTPPIIYIVDNSQHMKRVSAVFIQLCRVIFMQVLLATRACHYCTSAIFVSLSNGTVMTVYRQARALALSHEEYRLDSETVTLYCVWNWRKSFTNNKFRHRMMPVYQMCNNNTNLHYNRKSWIEKTFRGFMHWEMERSRIPRRIRKYSLSSGYWPDNRLV